MRILGDVLLLYLGAMAAVSALVTIMGLRALAPGARGLSRTQLKDLVTRRTHEEMSILVLLDRADLGGPETAAIGSTLDELRPGDELVVVTSDPRTIDVLVAELELTGVPTTHDEPLATASLRQVYRSARYPQLTVLDKAPDEHADALNSGLNTSRNPLVCVVGAGCAPDAEALVRIARPLAEDPDVVAVGGVVESGGRRGWRSVGDLLSQAAWSRMGTLLAVSADFACYRRADLERAGGFARAGSGAEAVLALKRHHLEKGTPARAVLAPDATCRSRGPSVRALPTTAVLWRNRDMLLRAPGLAMCWAWLRGPVHRLAIAMGVAYLAASALLGQPEGGFAVIFAALVVGWPALMAQIHAAVGGLVLEGRTSEAHPRRTAKAA